jgi:hypothetical protein
MKRLYLDRYKIGNMSASEKKSKSEEDNKNLRGY